MSEPFVRGAAAAERRIGRRKGKKETKSGIYVKVLSKEQLKAAALVTGSSKLGGSTSQPVNRKLFFTLYSSRSGGKERTNLPFAELHCSLDTRGLQKFKVVCPG